MGTEKPAPSVEGTLIRTARNQVVTREAALEAGITRAQLERRTRSGLLVVDSPGVYRLAGAPRSGDTANHAALESASGQAIGLWSALPEYRATQGAPTPSIVHVMIPWTRRVERTSWYIPHRTRSLERDEIHLIRGLPFTTMARSLRDLAAVLPATAQAMEQLEMWTEESLIQGTLRLASLAQAVDRERTSSVKARLHHLHERQDGDDLAEFRNRAETWLKELIDRLGLPRPQFNVRPPGLDQEVDAFRPDIPLIFEFDGFRYHHTRTKHAKDRRRDRRSLRAGIPTVRITKDDFEEYPPALEADVEFFLTGGLRA